MGARGRGRLVWEWGWVWVGGLTLLVGAQFGERGWVWSGGLALSLLFYRSLVPAHLCCQALLHP